MKIITFFVFYLFLLVSCKDKINSVQGVMKALTPEGQHSSIDPTIDNVIKGRKGTQIFIPANALRFKDGTIPAGKVNIELKEFFSTSDLISNNLSAVSDSFLLETNGMLYISAMADGKELVIDGNKSYTVAFPKKDSTKNMELFYGESRGKDNINWQPAIPTGEGFPFGYDSLLIDSTLYQNRITVCGYTSGINDDSVLWKFKNSNSTLFGYVSENFKPTDTAIKNSLCERGQMPGMTLEIDDKGKVSGINFDTTSFFGGTRIELRKQIADFFYNLPLFKMESMAKGQGRAVGLSLCCHTMFSYDEYKKRFDKKYSQYRNKAIQQIDRAELNFYILSATKFGWINCDRFYLDEREKIDFIVKAPSGDAKTFIVFDKINSIMAGRYQDGNFVFPNVPVDSKVRLIAIKFENGKPAMAVQQNTVSKNTVIVSGFKSFTITELEEQLNKS